MDQDNILLEEKVLHYEKRLRAFMGELIITDQNITFYQHKKWILSLGLLGTLIGLFISKGDERLNAKLSDVKFVKGRSVNKKSYIVEVHTDQAEKFDFLFNDAMLAKVSSVVNL